MPLAVVYMDGMDTITSDWVKTRRSWCMVFLLWGILIGFFILHVILWAVLREAVNRV